MLPLIPNEDRQFLFNVAQFFDGLAPCSPDSQPQRPFDLLREIPRESGKISGTRFAEGREVSGFICRFNYQRRESETEENVIDEQARDPPVSVVKRMNKDKFVMKSGDQLNGMKRFGF